MEKSRSIELDRSRDEIVEILARDETLLGLLPGDTELVASKGDRRTTRTHYRALGRDGVATFHFDRLVDGSVRFEKVCDGKVWRELSGLLSVEERGNGALVRIEMAGRTKGLVPEFTIKGPMEDQIEEMALALEALLA